MADDSEGHRVKRFKHQSYNQSLKDVHLPAAHNQTPLDNEIGDNDSHFHEALDHWRQLNLAPGFIQFANKADSLSASMPLLLHNWRQIIDLWMGALETSDDEGMRALLDLLQKMTHDLRTTLSPAYPDLLGRLLKLLPRSITAPALGVLLETLSTLFKFLLVPSIHFDLLEKTWTAVRDIMPTCLPEVQRAMAEVWGSVLRRLKTAAREKAVTLLAEKAEGVEDASAWVIVFACKSVSQTLHTATSSIMAPLLKAHLAADVPEPTYTLIRRVLTSLIHHVKNAEQFSPLADLLVRQVTEASKTTDMESLRRILEIISVPVAVRQGSRMTQSHLSILLAEALTIPIIPEMDTSLLKFSTAILMAAEMSLWLGPGYKLLQRSWASPDTLRFALKLNGCLADLGWGGWKLIALPLILKLTISPSVLEKEPRAVLRFLASLRRAKRLSSGETDLVWRERLEKWTLERLKTWNKESGEDAVCS
ncbi:hypothetical protein BDZ94DRAFT_790553 [Collybia nuda]|uniref:Uncharacterized protein n=1 Tax=Collybia nuda TaxID=64659 RepID=A0A9P5Y3Z5_9AGAR|nr:hypothetical protein BDZ94DRAFT_790553 [Collybia nuda]